MPVVLPFPSFRSFLGRRVDPRPLGRVRLIIGGLAVARGVEAFRILRLTHAPDALHLPLIAWLPELDPDLIPALIGVWLVSGLLFTIGWRVRLSGPVLLAAIGSTLLLDQRTYSNHLYLLWLLVLLLTVGNAGAAAAAGRRRGDVTVPEWAVTLLKIQLSIVYFFSAATKLNVYFLSGSVLCGTMTGWIALPASWRTPDVCSPLAILTVLLEVFLAAAFWLERWRLLGWIVGISFHVGIIVLLPERVSVQLVIFALAMVSLYTLFGPARRPRATSRQPA
ncbi:MAG: HTTM domain-containing protein [Gemmatimonadota bacterium]